MSTMLGQKLSVKFWLVQPTDNSQIYTMSEVSVKIFKDIYVIVATSNLELVYSLYESH